MSAWLVVWVSLTLVGFALLAWAWRGRSVGDAPHCGNCGFELSGLPIDGAACPECGRAPGGADGVVRGRRRVRRVAGGAACAVMVASAIGIVATSRGLANAVLQVMPDSALVLLADWGGVRALAELHDRFRDGELSESAIDAVKERAMGRLTGRPIPFDSTSGELLLSMALNARLMREEIDGLVAVGLAHQADEAAPFDAGWAGLLAELCSAGAMSPEHAAAYGRQSVEVSVQLRERLRPGVAIPIRIRLMGGRLADGGYSLPVTQGVQSVTMDGVELQNGGRPLGGGAVGGGWTASNLSVEFAEPPGPGTYTIDVVVRQSMYTDMALASPQTLLAQWDEVFTFEVEVVHGAGVAVPLVEGPPTPPPIGFGPLRVASAKLPTVQYAVEVNAIASGVMDTPMVGRVQARLPSGDLIECGSIWFPSVEAHGSAHRQAQRRPETYDRTVEVLPWEVEWPSTVDLIVTPDPDFAYMYPHIEQILGRTLVFRDVPVEVVESRGGGRDMLRFEEAVRAEFVGPP